MPKISRTALVNFSPEKMFDLVNDFESYPQFMPGCTGAELLAKGDSWLEARLTLSRAGITQSFVTHNDLIPPKSMVIRLVEGPFSIFQGAWTFIELGEAACKVEFQLEFEMKNKLVGLAVGKLLEGVASEQVKAISQRAKDVYG